MKKNIFKIIFTATFILMLVLPLISLAQSGNTGDGGDNSNPSTTTSSGTSGSGLTFNNAPQSACPPNTRISGIICNFQQILNSIIPLLIALGVVYFVFGVVQYVIAGDDEAKKTGRDRIIFGIIGLAVIIGLWGLVNIVVNTLGLGGTVPIDAINNLTVPPPTGPCTAINSSTSKFSDALNYVTCVIGKSVIPLIFAIAVVTFIWGAMKFFIFESDEEAKREQGKQFMLW